MSKNYSTLVTIKIRKYLTFIVLYFLLVAITFGKTNINDTALISKYVQKAVEYSKKDIDSSMKYAKRACILSKATNYYKFIESSISLSNAYNMSGNYEKALEYSLETYKYSKSINNYSFVPKILGDIGSDYLMLNDSAKALKYLRESLKMSNSYRTEITAKTNIAQVYAGFNRYTEAHEYYEQALSLAEREKNKRDIAVLYNRIGNLYLMEEIYDKSLIYYEKSVNMLDSNNLYYYVAGLRGIVENYIVTGKYDKGLKMAFLADSLASKGSFLYEKKILNQFISELYDSLRNYPKSLYYYKKYRMISDSIFDLDKYRKMNMLQADFETEKQQLLLLMAKKEANLNKRLNIIYLITCVLIIFLLIVFIINFRQKNKILQIDSEKNKLAKDLLWNEVNEKQREILSHSMQIQKQKEVLMAIESKLSIICQQEDASMNQSLKELESEIRSSIDKSDDWEDIQKHFEKIHPRFFQKLSVEFSGLSINDLKLCAYTKLKFSNKEISRLLNINSSSVHIARYRLKKKMNLPEAINFDEYILNNI